ncbi:MAG: peptidyl-prolyl cis-trans isomerase [Burkholderiales bacterium]|nr:peptidyl-prolyl cis-trans isomerase [Burkholderiales bacterium]
MFDFVRNHSRLTLGFLLLLIIPSFVVFGIEGYSRFQSAGNETVAKVAGQSVTRGEWEQAHDRLIDRARRQSPEAAEPLKSEQARVETLDNLLRERVLMAAATDLHLFPPVQRMARLFDADPQYAGLRGPDGKLSRELLAQLGMTPELFDQRLRQDYGMRQVLAGVAGSGFAPASTAAQSLDALLQRREIQVQRFDPIAYRAKVSPTEAELEAFYKANQALFRTPEQAQIEYVVLDAEALAQGLKLGDDELRKFYDGNLARFTEPEERRASHILIQADASASTEQKAAAKAKATALYEQAKAKPAAFAELAKKNSQDTASAPLGGDLEFSRRGSMASKALEDAVFSLAPGQVGGPVESEFGYHVVTVTAVRGGKARPFDDARAEIAAELRKSKVAKEWPAAAEQFTNMAYEQPDSLKPLEDKFKLDKKTASVTRAPTPGASGALASAKLLGAVFSNDAVRDKRNTDAVEVGPNQLAAARVVQHQPARVQPLAEVRDTVRERVIAEQSAALARKEGEARLAAVRAAPAAPLGETLTVSRLQARVLPPALLDAAMRADATQLPQVPQVRGVDLGAAGYAVLRVTKVLPRELPLGAAPGGPDPLRDQYAQAFAMAETEAYLAALKKRYKLEIKPAAKVAAASAAASAATGF